MSSTPERARRAPGSPEELDDFIEVVEWMHGEHRVSFVQAGDERIYAYGGRGFVVVLSERVFDGLVELETPRGALRVAPDASGALAVTVASPAGDAAAILRDACTGFRRYYEKRYWQV